MDPVTALDELIHFVIHNESVELNEQQLEPFQERDDVVQTAALHLGIGRPPNVKGPTIGFTRLPYVDTLSGVFLDPTREWRQEIKALRARLSKGLEEERKAKRAAAITPEVPFDVMLEDRAVVRTQNALIQYAKDNCGAQRLSDRTVRKWLSDGSLRYRYRGVLLEFSISDLQALCSAADFSDSTQVSRNKSGTDSE